MSSMRSGGAELDEEALCDGGPPTIARLGVPDQEADQGSDSVQRPSREEINLTPLRL